MYTPEPRRRRRLHSRAAAKRLLLLGWTSATEDADSPLKKLSGSAHHTHASVVDMSSRAWTQACAKPACMALSSVSQI